MIRTELVAFADSTALGVGCAGVCKGDVCDHDALPEDIVRIEGCVLKDGVDIRCVSLCLDLDVRDEKLFRRRTSLVVARKLKNMTISYSLWSREQSQREMADREVEMAKNHVVK